MNTLETLFLGLVQGLTEFLPISSSGHLVLFQNMLGFKEPQLLLDCSLHMGTLLAVCLYFRPDLKKMATETWKYAAPFLKGRFQHGEINLISSHSNLVLWVLVGSVPTGIIGLVFKTPLEKAFGSVSMVGMMLIITGVIVAATRLIPKAYETRNRIGLLIALTVGITQGFAIIPGISRSGTTIVCGLLFGLERELAARFSFLLSIPAIIGALAIQLNAESLEKIGFVPLLFGFCSAALVGLLALKLLMVMVKKGHLYYFAPYCWAVGLLVIIYA